jgi:hypothetical protein
VKIGCIIRSVGERTESLCVESAKQFLSEENVHLIRNVKPFSLAVKKMLDIAEDSEYDWYFGLDADIVLVEGWMDKVKIVLEEMKGEYYRVDFPIYDRFLPTTTYGVHFYDNRYTKEVKKILETTKSDNKPEGNIRHKMSAPCYNEPDLILGYHGYHQYYRDIFSRFALRYQRDRRYVRRYKIFDKMDKEKEIAKKGWEFAKGNKIDFNNAENRTLYNGEEIGDLDLSLEEFYKEIK